MSDYKSKGVDFDSLFDPDVIGDGPTAPSYKQGGTALKYADIQYGTKGPDVGYAQNGVDVSNLWAKKGSASYHTPDNGTAYVSSKRVNTGGTGAASVALLMRRGQYYVQVATNQGSTDYGPYDIPPGVTQFYTRLVLTSGADSHYAQTVVHDAVWTNLSSLSATSYTTLVTATLTINNAVQGQQDTSASTLTLNFGSGGVARFTGSNSWSLSVRGGV